jgi:nucleoside phosphorylase
MQRARVLEGTLVVGAWPPEVDGLADARAIGVGLVEAAAGIERALAEARPARVVLVGTAGAFADAGAPVAIGEVVVARAARLVLRDGEYAPAPMPLAAAADAALAAACAARLGARLVEVASPLGVTATDGEAARLRAAGAEAEQLECFAVLAACARAKIPATAILAIANRVGAGGAAEWRLHRAAAEERAKQSLRSAGLW